MGLRPVRRATVPGYPSRGAALRAALRSLRRAALAGGASALLGLAGCGAAQGHHETSGTGGSGSGDDATADGGGDPSGSAGDEDLPPPPGEPPATSLPKVTLGSPASPSPSWVPLHRGGAELAPSRGHARGRGTRPRFQGSREASQRTRS